MPRSIIVRRSPIHGNGVFAAIDLAAGRRLLAYAGRLLTHTAADRLYEGNVESGHTFLFTLNERYVIDGAVGGNSARWINHSCDPNCEAVLETIFGGSPKQDRIYIQTLRPIVAGEELTFNYGIVLPVRHTPRLKKLWQCRCGAANCSGTILSSKGR
jgi:SET domain-containing protein